MKKTKADYVVVSRNSPCRATGNTHVPGTREMLDENGQHLKLHVCKNCGGFIR